MGGRVVVLFFPAGAFDDFSLEGEFPGGLFRTEEVAAGDARDIFGVFYGLAGGTDERLRKLVEDVFHWATILKISLTVSSGRE